MWITCSLFAQSGETPGNEDAALPTSSVIEKKPFFQSMWLAADLLMLGRPLVQPQYQQGIHTQWGVHTSGILLFSADFFYERLHFEKMSYQYRQQGIAAAWGPSLLLTAKKRRENYISLGAKVGYAWPKESMTLTRTTAVFGETVHRSMPRRSFYWVETNLGVYATLWQNVAMGYTLRFMFFYREIAAHGEQILNNYFSPGYGDVNNRLRMHYYLYYSIPLTKSPDPTNR